ncbi:MAG TPA: phosphatase PAP2 family protein [Nocardioides sp.]|nr:phosphatase PAP2 family protein [Nocardioides sp.]
MGVVLFMPRPALRPGTRLRWIAGQTALVLAAVFFYFQVRGLTSTAPEVAFAHADQLMRLERETGVDVEDAVQAPVLATESLQVLANWIYIWGHWPVIVVTMFWLAWQHRRQFQRLRDAMVVSGAMGLVVFVTYPVAPPRLVDPDLVDTVTETSHAYRVLQPPNFVNQYAAMPSLHAGWDLLVGISIATATTHVALRIVGWALPPLMAFAVVATANHYIVDVVVGIAFALGGYAVAVLLDRRRQARGAEP